MKLVEFSHDFRLQIADPAEIEKMVDKVLSENPKQLEQYRSGKTKLQGFFAGQVLQNSVFGLISIFSSFPLPSDNIFLYADYEIIQR